jgi:hypothetical protein
MISELASFIDRAVVARDLPPLMSREIAWPGVSDVCGITNGRASRLVA